MSHAPGSGGRRGKMGCEVKSAQGGRGRVYPELYHSRPAALASFLPLYLSSPLLNCICTVVIALSSFLTCARDRAMSGSSTTMLGPGVGAEGASTEGEWRLKLRTCVRVRPDQTRRPIGRRERLRPQAGQGRSFRFAAKEPEGNFLSDLGPDLPLLYARTQARTTIPAL